MSHALQSESTKEIAAALAKAQSEMGHAHKDSKNPHFKSTFASLASVIDAVRESFGKNGLSFTQTMALNEKSDGSEILLCTTLHHASGEWIRGFLPIVAEKQTPQAIGSAISYMRRYSLSSMAGLSQTDDDGEAASEPAKASPFAKIADPGEYVVTFGKYGKKKLDSLDPYQVRDYCDFLVGKARDDGKPIQGQVKQFLDHASAWLALKGNGAPGGEEEWDSAADYAKGGNR